MLLQANTQLYGTQGIALGKSPDTGEIFSRAWQYGESRVISGAHWQSDVDMTRFAAAIAYSSLQTKPAFRSQMERAKKEFSAHMMGGGCGIIRGMIKSAAKTADGRAAD